MIFYTDETKTTAIAEADLTTAGQVVYGAWVGFGSAGDEDYEPPQEGWAVIKHPYSATSTSIGFSWQ